MNNILWNMWSLIFYTIILPLHIHCTGLFELRLTKFTNENGKDIFGTCCSKLMDDAGHCIGECNTRFVAYLGSYQGALDMKCTKCNFGNFGAVGTTVLGHNVIDVTTKSDFENVLNFPFKFAWPGKFTLLIETWHKPNKSSSPDVLISRSSIQDVLDPSHKWTQKHQISDQSILEYSYRVSCHGNYYGAGCTHLCRPRNDNFGHYTCSSTGERVCLSGWEGAYCDKASCLPGCDEHHGHCTKPNECLCRPGWKGTFCDECELHPGCLHGTCQTEWQCKCKKGWGGVLCNQDLEFCTNHRPCQNNGTCYNTGPGAYTCHCLSGFQGTNCEVAIADCNVSSCLNDGNCQDTGLGFKCQCPNGYGGFNCELQIDICISNPCDNGGSCTSKGGKFICLCPSGFTGERCEQNIDDCQGSPCLNGGTCIDVINQFKCQCVPGYIGTYCAYKPNLCLLKPCENGGSCINLVNDFRCLCRPGLTGKDCSINIDECISQPCKNGASCINLLNGFRCVCSKGIYGVECEIESNSGSNPQTTHHETGDEPKKPSYVAIVSFVFLIMIIVLTENVWLTICIANLIQNTWNIIVNMGKFAWFNFIKLRAENTDKKDDVEAMQHELNNSTNLRLDKSVSSSKPNFNYTANLINHTWDKDVNNMSKLVDGIHKSSLNDSVTNTKISFNGSAQVHGRTIGNAPGNNAKN